MIIEDGRVVGCGVIVVNSLGDLLLGKRSDGQGWCFAGGKVEEGEKIRYSALRELYEEFNVQVNLPDLFLVGVTESSAIVKGKQRDVKCYIFVTHKYNLPEIFVPNDEMLDFKWMSLEEIDGRDDIFIPSRESVKLYKSQLVREDFLMLIELKDGGIREIETDTRSYRGCETCDYGSEYTNELTIYFVNSGEQEIEATAMYEFPLSLDFLMKLFLNNVDFIKTLTEKECKKFIVDKVREKCSKVEVR